MRPDLVSMDHRLCLPWTILREAVDPLLQPADTMGIER